MANQTTLKAAIWSCIERLSTQVIAFIIGVVLARLLTPHDYGVVGLMAIFISISNVFIDSGFANALIRKPDVKEGDLATTFFFNIILGVIIYALLCLFSTYIAAYFNEPLLVSLIKIVGLNVLFYSFSIVQTAILTRNLNIKIQTIINITGQLPAGIIAIIFAYNGFGIYALALQSVLASFIKMVLLWIVTKWYPKSFFDSFSFRYLWSFGSKLLLSNLIGTIFNEIYSLLIGRFIGTTQLGYYSKSSHLNTNFNSISTGVVQKIALPILSKKQDDPSALCDNFRDVMRILVMFQAFFSLFLCLSAKDLITFLWTERWNEAIVPFQLLIIGSIFLPIGSVSLSLLQVVNRTDLILKLEVPKKTIYIILIALGLKYGVLGLCVTQIFINIIAALFNMWATKRVITYSYCRQIKDIIIYILIALLVVGTVIWINPFITPVFRLLFTLVLGFFCYSCFLYLIKDKCFLRLNKLIYNNYFK